LLSVAAGIGGEKMFDFIQINLMAHFRDYNRFLLDLQNSIQSERGAIDFYEQLARLAPTHFSRETVQQALRDEQRHNNVLTALYLQLTGTEPVISSQTNVSVTFLQGLETAVEDELTAAEIYKRMCLNARKRLIRDIFFDIMNDEHQHAIRFAYTKGI
jgi:rubrerythrin